MNINVCEDGSVVAHKGPMLLNILVIRNDSPDIDLAQKGVDWAFSLLDLLSRNKQVITTNIAVVDRDASYPTVIRKMIDAVLRTGDESLTPLAAVAGAVSEEVADYLFQQEDVSKVIVNNGGDIAIRLKPGESARVGINTDYSKRDLSHALTVNKEISGITTSGLGGRSFTKGIASAVVVWAETASLADALSTLIGNKTDVEDPLILRQPAEELYPDTDIPGQMVTISVGDIGTAKIDEALANGMAAVDDLRNKGLDFETLIAVKGEVRITEGMSAYITRINAAAERAAEDLI